MVEVFCANRECAKEICCLQCENFGCECTCGYFEYFESVPTPNDMWECCENAIIKVK